MSRPFDGNVFTFGAALAAACLSAGAATHLVAQDARAPGPVVVDTVFHGLDSRPIGPPGTSGRVAAIAVSPRDLREVWVGAATGGLWKSVDGAFTWQPVMDSEPVNSIGAIGISSSAPDVVYVGTGEANTRNSMGVGRGLWKSTDGGRTWTRKGLEGTERIEAVLVPARSGLRPRDPPGATVRSGASSSPPMAGTAGGRSCTLISGQALSSW